MPACATDLTPYLLKSLIYNDILSHLKLSTSSPAKPQGTCGSLTCHRLSNSNFLPPLQREFKFCQKTQKPESSCYSSYYFCSNSTSHYDAITISLVSSCHLLQAYITLRMHPKETFLFVVKKIG